MILSVYILGIMTATHIRGEVLEALISWHSTNENTRMTVRNLHYKGKYARLRSLQAMSRCGIRICAEQVTALAILA